MPRENVIHRAGGSRSGPLARLRALEERARRWLLGWGYGLGPRRSRGGVTEQQALVALLAGAYLVRTALAGMILAAWFDWVFSRDLQVSESARSYLVVLLPLFGATLLHLVWGALRSLRHGRVPPHGQLVVGASLDVLWMIAGYMVSGFSALPFPALLILAVGFHSIFLSALGAAWVTGLASTLFFAMSTLATSLRSPAISGPTQVALFVGVGILCALMGNRIRAAIWTVETLQRTVDRLSGYHADFLSALPLGVLSFSAEHPLPEGNASAWAMMGLARPAMGRLGPADLFPSLPELARAVEAGLRGAPGSALPDSASGEGRIGSGAGRWVSWVVVTRDVPDPHYRPSALAAPPFQGARRLSDDSLLLRTVTVLLTDLTDRLQGVAMQRQAERFAAVAELSAGLAHEVRNPIAALRSSAEQLAEFAALDEADQRLLAVVIRESDRLNRLVGEFLDFARVGGGAPGRVDLGRALADASAIALRSRGGARVHLVSDLPSSPGELLVDADGDLLFRALSNLLLNAVQFSPEDGTIFVAVERSDDAHFVRIRIRDEGPGVSARVQARLFSPFVTSRPGGTGLGLAIAHRSATLLGGRLELELTGADGSTFCLTLPTPAARKGAPAPSPGSPTSPSGPAPST
jgi:two-component system sensor histidine kinase PilS (NtrC family)